MNKVKKYSPETRERAVRLVFEHCRVDDRQAAARVLPKNLLLCQTVSWNEE